MKAVDYEKKEAELNQKIRALQKEKRRLKDREKSAKRKHEDHIKILVGATFLTHYDKSTIEKLYNEMSDEQVKEWVNGKFPI